MSGFSIILAIVSLLTALIPLADHGLTFIEHRQVQVTVNKPVLPPEPEPEPVVVPPVPPDAGSPNVVCVNGQWWKLENGKWLVWTNQPQQVAQGGYPGVVR